MEFLPKVPVPVDRGFLKPNEGAVAGEKATSAVKEEDTEDLGDVVASEGLEVVLASDAVVFARLGVM